MSELKRSAEEKRMTYTKKKWSSVIGSVALVLICRSLESFSPAFDIPLMPGGILNLFVSGVHGNWHTPVGEFVTLVPSALFWMVAIYGVLSLAGVIRGKKEPIQSSQPTSLTRRG